MGGQRSGENVQVAGQDRQSVGENVQIVCREWSVYLPVVVRCRGEAGQVDGVSQSRTNPAR